MGDLFDTLLPYLPASPFAIIAIILYRQWTSALAITASVIKELRVERADHRVTQQELDAEREGRRKVEDKMDEFRREVQGLKVELSRQTAELARQTTEVSRLTTEVARLRAKVGELT